MKRLSKILGFIIVFTIVLLSMQVITFAEELGTWTTKSDFPLATYACSSAELNGKIYTVTGKSIYEYNISSDVWTKKTDMSISRASSSVAVVNNKLYVIGGSLGERNEVEEYDPETDTWKTKLSMPTPRYWAGAAVVNNKIYIFGGMPSSQGTLTCLNTVEEYDPANNTWTSKANMPVGMYGASSTTVDGKIYIIGGFKPLATNTVFEYSPITDSWETKANMPTARGHVGTAVINNKIYAIGGYSSSNGALNKTEVFDPTTNTWSTKQSMITARRGFGISSINGQIICVGGLGVGTEYLKTVEVYNEMITQAPETPTVIGNSAILEITMTNGAIKEYDLTAIELQNFLTWYDGRANGTDKAYYIFNKKNNIKPFLSRKEYISFDKISSFEVKEYDE